MVQAIGAGAPAADARTSQVRGRRQGRCGTSGVTDRAIEICHAGVSAGCAFICAGRVHGLALVLVRVVAKVLRGRACFVLAIAGHGCPSQL